MSRDHFRIKAGYPPLKIVGVDGNDSGDGDAANTDLLCRHPGCTNRWTIQGDRGTKCSKHYWNESEPLALGMT